MIMEGTKPVNLIKPMNMEGTPPPTGASPTQPYKCSQYFKVKTAKNGRDHTSGHARLHLTTLTTQRPKGADCAIAIFGLCFRLAEIITVAWRPHVPSGV